MAKPHGTYAKLHESLADHPKTLDLARRLAPVLGLSADMVVPFVFLGVAKLACYCIRESETGEIGHLTDGKFCDAIGLPREISDVAAVAAAWRESGFLDVDGSSVKLHEFEHYAGSLLKDRARKRASRTTETDEKPSAECPRNVRGPSSDSRARVRNTEDGRRNMETNPNPSAGAEGVLSAPPKRRTAKRRTGQPPHDDAAKLIEAHQRLLPDNRRVQQPPKPGVLEVASKALDRRPLAEWLAYLEEVATEGRDGFLWTEGNLDMVLRPATVSKWEAGQYRPRRTPDRRATYDVAAGAARLLGIGEEHNREPKIIDTDLDAGSHGALPGPARNGMDGIRPGPSGFGTPHPRLAGHAG